MDWYGVNFLNCTNIGTIKNYNNFIFSDGAFLNSSGMNFDENNGTIGFTQCFFDCNSNGSCINILSTAIISRRFRIIYSSFVINNSEVGISVDNAANIPNDGYILDTVSFSGNGVYTSGVAQSDNKCLWINCRGIINTASTALAYMNNNNTASPTNILNQFVKISGTTIPSSANQKFSHSNNRLTYTGSLTKYFKVSAILSASDGTNINIAARIAKNNTTLPESEAKATTSGNGRIENIKLQTLVELSQNDYIEIFVANKTNTNTIVVNDLNFIIEPLS